MCGIGIELFDLESSMEDKMTKEEKDLLDKVALKANNTELVLTLFIQFMDKEPDFKKFIIDWQEEQKKKRKNNV